MIEQEKADKSSGMFTFHCHASEKTWAHQRRKRRENLRKNSTHENAERGQLCSDELVKEQADDALNDTETQDTPEDNNTSTKTLKAEEAFTDSFVSKSAEFNFQESPLQSNEPRQDETGPRPAFMSFLVRVGTGEEVGNEQPRDGVVLEMTWVDGQDKNDLYQLYQYFQNKLLKGF